MASLGVASLLAHTHLIRYSRCRFGDRFPKVEVSLDGFQISKVKSGGRRETPGSRSSKKKSEELRTILRKASSGTTNAPEVEPVARGDRLRRSSMLHEQRQHLKEFSLKNIDLANSNRQKYIFEAPTVKDTRHW